MQALCQRSQSSASDILADKAGRRKRVCRGCCSCRTAPPQNPGLSAGNQQHSRCLEGTETPLGCHWGKEGEKDRDEHDGEEVILLDIIVQSVNMDEKS